MDLCRKYGKEWVTIIRKGDSVPEAEEWARKFCEEQNSIFIHPFNDQ
jgi:threonine dehydratase